MTPSPATHPEPPAAGPLWRPGLVAAGVVLVLLGAVVLLAWAAGQLEYVQLDPSLPPPHSNAALGFLVWGGGYLAVATGRRRFARRLAHALVAPGHVLLLGSHPAVGLPLERWAAPVPAKLQVPPGGAFPGLAIALCVAAGAVLVAARPVPPRFGPAAFAAAGLFLVVGAPLAYAVRLGAAGTGARPSPLAAAGVALGGLPLLTGLVRACFTWSRLGRALPATVGVAGVLLTVGLWLALDGEQKRRIHRQVQFEAAHLQRLARQRLPEQLAGVTELAERWDRIDAEERREDVGGYIGRTPGCLGVARLAPDLTLAWVETSQSAPPPRDLGGLGAADAIIAAEDAGRPLLVRAPRSHWNGGRVLLAFAPHRPGVGGAGGLVAAFRPDDLIGTAISANMATGYGVVVADGGEQLFGRFAAHPDARGRWCQVLPLEVGGFTWQLAVWPTGEVLDRESLSVPKLALGVGLLTTVLLALAVHLALTARQRTADLEREAREREAAEVALKQSEGKYRTLIENLEQGIFLQDRDGRYAAANRRFCETVGRAEPDVLGRTEADLFDPQRAAQYREEARTVLAEGKAVEGEEDRTSDGRRTCVRRVLTPVRDAAGQVTGVLGICWDVTEQRLLEAHVNQASKMDAIGQLAGGIAHDFNNLLTAILGNLELILPDLPPHSRPRELAEAARNAGTRAASLTQRLLGFSRRHHLDWAPTDLNAVVDEVVGLLSPAIDPRVRIETRPDPGLWPVHADAAQLNQVLMNLCLNARDAIAGPGRVTVETARVTAAEARDAAGRNGRAGEFVRLRVTDTGAGMTDEVKARIFEPFFTTKEVGRGTGLGLPMVFAIVREHKGWIDCHSEVGRGTRFDVYLPRGEAARAEAETRTAAPAARQAGKGTVLVVDDEDLIRQVAVAALRAAGHTVLEAADGQQALNIYAREGDRIDLVLLDLTMPVLSGHETFRHLLRFDARVKVVFASGYAVEHLSDLEKELMAGFLKKPYRPHELLAAVGDALRPDPRHAEEEVPVAVG